MSSLDNNRQTVQYKNESIAIIEHLYGVEERFSYKDFAIKENATDCDLDFNAGNVDDFIEVWMKIKQSIEG